MSRQTDVFHDVAAAINAGAAIDVAKWFTETFRLHDPNTPGWPSGHAGASRMLTQIASLGPTAKLEVLDTVEQDDRVAVRWRLSAVRDGEAFKFAIMALYRFEDGRIAEDWGVSFRGEWP